jgi:sugar (pentulose or hexulose) kinase
MRSLKMIGGAASSPIWPEIIANVTGLPVELPNASEAAGLGAAILAGIGAGRFHDVEEAYHAVKKQERSLQPDNALSNLYDAGFQRYQSMWNTLHSEERNDWMAEKQRLA